LLLKKFMSRGQKPAAALPLSERQRRLLTSEISKRTTLRQYAERIPIVLLGGEGINNSEVSRRLGIQANTVRTWRKRWLNDYATLLVFESGVGGAGVSDFALLQEMLKRFDDLPRSGTPKRITLAQEQQIIALACEKPEDYGIPITTWSLSMLADVAISKDIVKTISARYVAEILKKKPVATA
jgi:transposase-like protein